MIGKMTEEFNVAVYRKKIGSVIVRLGGWEVGRSGEARSLLQNDALTKWTCVGVPLRSCLPSFSAPIMILVTGIAPVITT